MQNVRTLNQQTHQKTSRAKILTRQVPRKSKSNLDQFYPIWDFLPKKSSRKIPNSSSWVHGPRRARAPRASRTGSLGANGIGFCGWFIWDQFWENLKFEIISMRGQEFVHCFLLGTWLDCCGVFLLGMKSFLMRKSHDDGHAFEGSGLSSAASIAVLCVCVWPLSQVIQKNGEKSVTWRWMGWTCFFLRRSVDDPAMARL